MAKTWRVAVDCDSTVSASPKLWQFLTDAIRKAGGEVHIVTATHHDKATQEDYGQRKGQLKDLDISYDALYIACPPIAENKASYCKTAEIDFLIDNRPLNVANAVQVCPAAIFIAQAEDKLEPVMGVK